MLQRAACKGRALLRVLYFAPFVLSEVVTGVIWTLMLQPGGLVDGVLPVQTRLARRPEHRPLHASSSSISWKYFGFHMVLYLAGLQQIPRELEEAALIDGAERLAGLPLRDAAAARARRSGSASFLSHHRRDPALRPRVGDDRRRAGARVEHDGRLHDRLGLQALPVRLRQRGRGDHARDLARVRADLPALRPAARHRRRPDHAWADEALRSSTPSR